MGSGVRVTYPRCGKEKDSYKGRYAKRSFKAKKILRALLAALAELPSPLNLAFKTIIICLVLRSFWGLLGARWVKGRSVQVAAWGGGRMLPIFECECLWYFGEYRSDDRRCCFLLRLLFASGDMHVK